MNRAIFVADLASVATSPLLTTIDEWRTGQPRARSPARRQTGACRTGTTDLTSVSCPSSKFCMAVGRNSSSEGVAYTFSLPS